MRLFCIHLFCHSSVYNYGKFRKNRRTRFEKRDKVVSIFFSGHPVLYGVPELSEHFILTS